YGQLSVGQQRRVVLAIAVAHKPKLLILDEPTAGLDVVSRVELHKIIEELKNDDTSILLASHDMAEVEKLADKVVVLLKGEIVKEGTPEEISQSMNKLTKIAIRTEEPIDNYKNINVNLKKLNESSNYYEVYSEDINKMLFELVNYVNKNNNKIIDLKVERPNLEETFIKLTKIGG
ncbi:MAG: ATP-binding cassette domain-containing protein, partial [Clostridium perfringens]|nr:ATP-binding cassette domain-containing protein [Clostridium perfringens]